MQTLRNITEEIPFREKSKKKNKKPPTADNCQEINGLPGREETTALYDQGWDEVILSTKKGYCA